MNETGKKEIAFPCRWEFRLAVEAPLAAAARAAALRILAARDPAAEVTAGESSARGRYAALRAAAAVASREELDAVCRELATVPGFKLLF